ncbi:hypothetical protein M758_2G219800 [Ceratodon purpureus]|nr:hypothetical protein M758_2G219800 [Ceratodon purpureus]
MQLQVLCQKRAQSSIILPVDPRAQGSKNFTSKAAAVLLFNKSALCRQEITYKQSRRSTAVCRCPQAERLQPTLLSFEVGAARPRNGIPATFVWNMSLPIRCWTLTSRNR